mgnify:CR=1 FL=1
MKPYQQFTTYNIMIIDPDYKSREIFDRLLSSFSQTHIVGKFSHPREIPGELSRYRPDLILLDIHLVESEVAAFKEFLQTLGDRVCIVLTSFIHHNAFEFLSRHVFATIMKPVDPEEVARLLQRFAAFMAPNQRSGCNGFGNHLSFDKALVVYLNPSTFESC